MLELPDVTLVLYDAKAPDLARLALVDCCAKIKFGAVMVWSDSPELLGSLGDSVDSTKLVPSDSPISDYERTIRHEMPFAVQTSHFLSIGWDSWVLDAGCWQAGWLQYDYIAPPWPWQPPGLDVGCGGFSMRSTRLGRYMSGRKEFEVETPEDVTLCVHYRSRLEDAGFLFAPRYEAALFGFEREVARRSFGFHGCFNWPAVLHPNGLAQRKALASDYVLNKAEWREIA